MKLLPRKMTVRNVTLGNEGNVSVHLSGPIPDMDDLGTWYGPDNTLTVSARQSQMRKFPVVGQEVDVSIRMNWEGEDI